MTIINKSNKICSKGDSSEARLRESVNEGVVFTVKNVQNHSAYKQIISGGQEFEFTNISGTMPASLIAETLALIYRNYPEVKPLGKLYEPILLKIPNLVVYVDLDAIAPLRIFDKKKKAVFGVKNMYGSGGYKSCVQLGYDYFSSLKNKLDASGYKWSMGSWSNSMVYEIFV